MIDDSVILLVDDDADVLEAIAIQLRAKGWEVECAARGIEALERLKEAPERYGVVVTDVVMPEMDGYQLCAKIKYDEQTQSVPVVLVSGASPSIEEKTKGYALGAEDFIAKPVDIDELSIKLAHLVELKSRQSELSEQLSQSQAIAMQAMTYSSDLGQVLEFYKNSIAARDFEALAGLLFEFAGGRGLRCTLQVITPRGVLNFGDRGPVPPLEANVIELSRREGRIFDFGPRTIFNHDDFSLLIKNMPVEEPERYGILKDTLGTLCNAIEARIKFLLHEDSARQKREIASTVLGLLEEIDATFSDIREANQQVIGRLIDDLDDAMLDLGLTSHQEELVRKLVETCRDDSNAVFERSAVLYDKFEQVRTKIDAILGDG